MAEAADQKLFYKIGELCTMLGLEPHTLRYWEKEFPFLSPQKNSAGQRIYSSEDVRLIRRIMTLLYQQAYTIEGARRQLTTEREGHPAHREEGGGRADSVAEENRRLREALHLVKEELKTLAAMLRDGRPPGEAAS
ncbi:MAG: MerR family transcriptional regulator [Acidobacteriota bacterium]|nr:MAG: MerR family transcriptional regulator [Acidobacteriota bacterium]